MNKIMIIDLFKDIKLPLKVKIFLIINILPNGSKKKLKYVHII